MNRTITVTGTGKLKLRPDRTVVSLSLKAADMLYDRAMDKAAAQQTQLHEALAAVGFAKEELKTTDFHVGTEYENERDKNGNYRQKFAGYCVRHRLKAEFPLDTAYLSKILSAISSCIAEPELDIRFTVKDSDTVNAALLESACINARANAEILAKASGVSLCRLLSVNYSFGELQLYSPTRYETENSCMMKACAVPSSIAIEPDDIDISDSVTFVWEIA